MLKIDINIINKIDKTNTVHLSVCQLHYRNAKM